MRLLRRSLLILLVAYVGFAVLLFLFQSRLIFYPDVERELRLTPAQFGLPFENVSLSARDGVSLHGWYVPVTKAEARGTVLFLHGNAGNISHRIDSLQMFHRMGFSVLIIDYRGYGQSGGAPSEQGTYLDAGAAWRHLVEERRVPPCRIVLFGESLGGAIAAKLAREQKPAALVIASSFTSVPDLAQHIYPYLPVRWLARFQYDTLAALRGIEVPVLIAHSPDDEIVPFSHGLKLYEAVQAPKQFLELSGGHNEGFIFMRQSWIDALSVFLMKHAGRG